MKVFTLRQPWATLVVTGAKVIETRSFATNHRGPVLIHASKTMTAFEEKLCTKQPFKKMLKDFDEAPLGCIIGKVDIISVVDVEFYKRCGKGIPLHHDKPYSKKDWEIEFAFGDYSPGRYGWLLDKPVPFKHHIPFSGGVGFTKTFDERICLGCGCTEDDCSVCIEETGQPCYWVEENLCSACALGKENIQSLDALKTFKHSLKKAFPS
jgi:hypothetical protein